MGYTTDFNGEFNLNKPLTEAHAAYLHKFSENRRMKRNGDKTAKRKDPLRDAVGLGVGIDGGYFVGETGTCGQDDGADVVDHNEPPRDQPGLWCQWIPTLDRKGIQWDGGEKFYEFVEWIVYLIEHFLEPWGYKLNGEVEWEGEDHGDLGQIVIEDNMVSEKQGRVVYD